MTRQPQIPPSICAVIPAYNAADTVAAVIAGTLRHVDTVIVADDGSTDGTAAAAAGAGARVIRIPCNRGKGHALRQLFKEAEEKGFAAAICLDADGQHDPDDIPVFLEAHQHDPRQLIVGNRMRTAATIPRGRFNSMHIARFFVSLGATRFIEDTQCGFRLYPLEILGSMELTSQRYVTETEILIKAGDSGFGIRHVPVKTIYGSNTSHFRAVLDIDAINAWVCSYVWIKWGIEAVCPNRPHTYRKGGLRDRIGRHPFLDGRFMVFTLGTIFPAVALYWLADLLGRLLGKNNLASVRNLGGSFYPVMMAVEMCPVLLLITIAEQTARRFGLQPDWIDPFIRRFFPDLWKKERAMGERR